MSSHPGPDTHADFDAWLDKAYRKILRRAYFVTRDQKLAEDIAHEAILKLYKAWDNEEMRDKVLTQPGYVRTTIYRCFLDHIKVPSRTNQKEVEFDAERHDRPGTEIDHEVRLAVLSLDGKERDMIVLHDYYGLTIKEAGSQLGLSQSQAYRLHESALAHLSGLLDEGEA